MLPLPRPSAGTIIAALALGTASGAAIVQTLRLADARAELAQARQAQADYAAAAAQATADAVQAARDEEQRRTAAIQEIADAASNALAVARADAVRARAAADRLRRAAETYAAAHCGAGPEDPAVAPGSAPATGPGLVLADLFGRADDTAGDLAAAFDAARAAGLACQRAYDSLTAEGVL